MKTIALVVAADEGRGIGKGGKLPWRLPGEMAYFKRLTSEARDDLQNAVVMGRKTYESIAPRFRPLSRRRNVVLSRDRAYTAEGVDVVHSLEEALALVDTPNIDRVFIIGGAELYAQALVHPACKYVHLTRVHAHFACDTTLPPFEPHYDLTWHDGPHSEADLTYSFQLWERR